MNVFDEIKKRAKELQEDPVFMKKLNKETRHLKGKKLKKYAQKALFLSQKEVK